METSLMEPIGVSWRQSIILDPEEEVKLPELSEEEEKVLAHGEKLDQEEEDLLQPQGYLYKKGNKGLFKTWLKRWFTVRRNMLYYSEHRFMEEICGKIDLKHVISIRAAPYHSLSSRIFKTNDCHFQIVVENRTFLLMADTPEEMIHWVEALNKVRSRYCSLAMKSADDEQVQKLLQSWVMLESAVSFDDFETKPNPTKEDIAPKSLSVSDSISLPSLSSDAMNSPSLK